MTDIALFQLASKRMSWLSARQSLVAQNIANASNPGYRARDARPFEDFLARSTSAASMNVTHARHIAMGAGQAGLARPVDVENHEVRLSDNTVRLDQEMMKASAIGADAALGAGVMRSFHRMLLAAAKG